MNRIEIIILTIADDKDFGRKLCNDKILFYTSNRIFSLEN